MNLVELKATLDAAATKLAASPDDAALKDAHAVAKTAYDDAVAASGKTGDDDEDGALDDSGLDEKTKKYIEKLRRENAKHRTKANVNSDRLSRLEEGLKKVLGGEDEAAPEQQLEALASQNEGMAFKMAVLEAAIECGVSKEDREYFEFLLGKRLGEMEEGQELADEEIAEIAKLAKRFDAGSGKSAGRSSVDDSRSGKMGNGTGAVTVEQFVAMTITEKSDLYTKNKALYDSLFAEAKNKRRI